MKNTYTELWRRLNAHWNRGGGYVVARLWWLVFALNVMNVCFVFPLFLQEGHQQSYQTDSLSNLKQIGWGIQVYLQDYDERLPPMNNTTAAQDALAAYVRSDNLWLTPQLNVPYAVNPSLSYHPLGDYAHPDKVVAVWDTKLWDGGDSRYGYVCFLDAHVKAVKRSEWARLRALSGIVHDVPAPPEPSWWSTSTKEDRAGLLAAILFLVSLICAFWAAWCEAWYWAGGREESGAFRFNFACWLCIRFVGYGLAVLFASLVLSFLITLSSGPAPRE